MEPEDKVFGIELYDPINGKFSPVNADNIGIGAILTKPIKHNGNFEQIITTELPGNKKPNLTISDGAFANEIMEFQVTLSEPSDKEISVKYFTFVDTEMEELEGGIQKDTLVFLPGETQKTITIPNGNYWEKLGLDWTEVDFSSFGVKLFKAKNANVIDDIGIGKLDFPVTTAAIGEEGGIDDPIVTTSAMGEEGGSYDPITTEAIGEEGGSDDGGATTLAMGEEGGGDDEPIFTTLAIGEEGGGNGGGATTLAIGEEGGIDNGATTLALGEEGGSNDDNVSYTTLALGEEGGLETTMAIGEEGGDWGNASIDVLDVM